LVCRNCFQRISSTTAFMEASALSIHFTSDPAFRSAQSPTAEGRNEKRQQSSVIGHRSSVIGHQSSVISHRSSVKNLAKKTTSCQLATQRTLSFHRENDLDDIPGPCWNIS
jgi:hypothetical protein